MGNENVNYRGVILCPMAAYDDGKYAAMLLIEEESGQQRATGVIDHFPTANLARRAAIDFGIAMVDSELLAS